MKLNPSSPDGYSKDCFGKIIPAFSDRIETGSTNAIWCERFFYVRDPDNHQIAIAKPL
ncbi:MAG: hypothetical protein OEY10_08295 [Nitrosopumilus sp.]|nr:hypothetical protein [Nitrosopumilus sp.]